MKKGTAKFLRVSAVLPHFAYVEVEAVTSHSSSVEIACSGAGFTSQGHIEDVSSKGYDDWKTGAKIGVLHALSVAKITTCGVLITKIQGVSTDTNPTVVGVAAALATWNALGFSPPEVNVQTLEEKAITSWRQKHDALPQFA